MTWHEDDSWGDVRVRFAGKGWPRDRQPAGRALLPEGVEIAWLDQIHSAETYVIEGPGCGGDGDALVSDRRALALSVVTADCVPVLLAGDQQIAAVHAGWRGIVAEVIGAAIERFETPPRVAWIGPAISGAVYEVSDEVAQQVATASSPEVILPGKGERPHVDLVRAASIQLERRAPGVEIRRVAHCTLSRDDILWSYRREGASAGRNHSLLWRESR